MKKKLFIIIPICLMLLCNVAIYFYDNNLNKNVSLVDVSGDKKHLKDIKIDSLINNNPYSFREMSIKNSSVSIKNISSDSYEKYANEFYSYDIFNKKENSDLFKYLKGYVYENGFSDGKTEGVVGIDNLYDSNNYYTLKIVTKNLENNKIDEFEFNIDKEEYYSSNTRISSNIKGSKLYILISYEYYNDSGEDSYIKNDVYCIDLENKNVTKVSSKNSKIELSNYFATFYYKDSMYTLVNSISYEEENNTQQIKDEYILYKYDINTNKLDKIDFYDKYLKDSKIYEDNLINHKIQDNKLILVFMDEVVRTNLKFVSIDLDNNSTKTADVKIPDIMYLDEDNYNYSFGIHNFYIKDDKIVLLAEFKDNNYSILVFDNDTSKNLYSGYVDFNFYPSFNSINFE